MPRFSSYDSWKTRSPDDERYLNDPEPEPENDEEEVMNNELTKHETHLPATNELDNLLSAASEDAGLQKMLKFKKGHYYLGGDEEVPLGREYLAHCIGWTKSWIRFENGMPTEKHYYRAAIGEQPPERDELGDMDSSKWPPGIAGEHSDPWVQQYMLPLEDLETGEQVIFVTGSFGGRRAVGELCTAYARRRQRFPDTGQPKVRIETIDMPTKRYGDVPRPCFAIFGWDGADKEPIRDIRGTVDVERRDDDFDDRIPF